MFIRFLKVCLGIVAGIFVPLGFTCAFEKVFNVPYLPEPIIINWLMGLCLILLVVGIVLILSEICNYVVYGKL